MVALWLVGISGCGHSSGANVLYAVGVGSPNVTIFDVESGGALEITGNSVSTGSAPDVIAIDPLLRFAYVIDSAGGVGAGGVSQYVLTRKNGALTIATFSSTNGSTPAATPVPTGVNPISMAVDGTGYFVFVANQGSSSLSGFAIDQIGGTLTEIKQLPPTTLNCMTNQITPCPLPTAGAPTALSTTGSMLFVAMTNAEAGSIATYIFNPEPTPPPLTPTACPGGPGCLQSPPASTVAAGTNPVAMALDSSGKFLFVADSTNNTVMEFSIGSSGQLSAVGSPIATGTTPVSVQVSQSGFVFTANQGSNNVSAFSFGSSGLTAVSGSPFSVMPGTGPSYVLVDGSGNFLFVA
ncbi:MAG TPA: beta-propeller fold lactonase family protein, partial [Candidatus Bathyarchaeia archaeon]|nr:beta-propeller fold lactonase family protein [Candidatus Bathyarchaeia archaeon]